MVSPGGCVTWFFLSPSFEDRQAPKKKKNSHFWAKMLRKSEPKILSQMVVSLMVVNLGKKKGPLPETNISILKIDPWKRRFRTWKPSFFGGDVTLVSGRSIPTNRARDFINPWVFLRKHVFCNKGLWLSRRWFQIFCIFTPTWGNDQFWLIFFKWVETTN